MGSQARRSAAEAERWQNTELRGAFCRSQPPRGQRIPIVAASDTPPVSHANRAPGELVLFPVRAPNPNDRKKILPTTAGDLGNTGSSVLRQHRIHINVARSR